MSHDRPTSDRQRNCKTRAAIPALSISGACRGRIGRGRPLVLLPTRLRPSWVGRRCPRRLGRYGATRRAGIAQRCRARRSMNRPGSQWDPSSHCAGFRSWPTAWTRKTAPDLRIRDEDCRIVVCQAVASVQVSACRLRRRRWPRPDRRRFDSRTCAWRLRVPRSYCGYELRRAVIVCSRPYRNPVLAGHGQDARRGAGPALSRGVSARVCGVSAFGSAVRAGLERVVRGFWGPNVPTRR